MNDNLKIEILKTYFSKEFVEKNSDIFILPDINKKYKIAEHIIIKKIHFITKKIHFIHKLVLMLDDNGNDFYDSKYLQEDILQVLKKYIELYPEDCNFQTNSGDTALMYICENSIINEEMISYFANSNLDLQDEHGRTALMLLCLHSNVNDEMISYFANSNLDLQNDFGVTALMFLCLNSNININTKIISYFMNSNLNLKNDDGKTFLHYICRDNKIEILNYILN